MKRTAYASDLTDAEWQRIETLIPPAKSGGRPRSQDMRAVLDAILFYVSHQGCGWRAVPADLPPWETVYYYYSCWQGDGTLELILGALWRVRTCEVGQQWSSNEDDGPARSVQQY
jgi:putative transposase